MNYCNEIEVDGKRFISDYRVKNGDVPFSKGKLSDLAEWYYRSQGLGDLLSSVIVDMKEEDYKIIEYKGSQGRMFALGI